MIAGGVVATFVVALEGIVVKAELVLPSFSPTQQWLSAISLSDRTAVMSSTMVLARVSEMHRICRGIIKRTG
jgi:hypothetical protein